MFFSKINLVIAKIKIFKIFFQLLKVKIRYKLHIYIFYYANVFKKTYKKVLKYAKMSNFFQNTQNDGFWNSDFWFLSRGKNGSCKLPFIWMQAKMKELVSLSPTSLPPFLPPILCVCNITTKRFTGWGKNGELLTRGRKNVVLYTVTI